MHAITTCQDLSSCVANTNHSLSCWMTDHYRKDIFRIIYTPYRLSITMAIVRVCIASSIMSKCDWSQYCNNCVFLFHDEILRDCWLHLSSHPIVMMCPCFRSLQMTTWSNVFSPIPILLPSFSSLASRHMHVANAVSILWHGGLGM